MSIRRLFRRLNGLIAHARRERHLRALTSEALALACAKGDERANAALAEWLLRSQDHVQVWLELTAFCEEAHQRLGGAPVEAGEELAATVQPPQTRLQRSVHSRKVWLLAAAVVIGVIAVGTLRQFRTEYATSVGEHRLVQLDDGTKVHLNTNSRIAVSFTRSTRTVELLSGEALFDIGSDKRPFRVISGDLKIEDIGTRFSVRAEPDTLAVAVLDGRIRLQPRRGRPWPHAPEFSGGDALTVSTQSEPFVITRTPTPIEQLERQLSWTEGKLVFQDVPLEKVVAEFNRYNLRQLQIVDPTIASLRIGGQFSTTDPEEFALALRALRVRVLPESREGATASIRLVGATGP
jgi:transmembrane sensor